MKKFILVFTVLCCGISFAQVTYGAKAGLNVSKVRNVHAGSQKRVGPFVGGFVSIPLMNYSQEFFLQPELLYSGFGEKQDNENVNMDYLLMPVLMKVYFSDQDTEFFAEGGPQFGIMVNNSVPDNYQHEFNTLEYGLTVGVGFSYLRTWEINGRFYYGLSDSIDDLAAAKNNHSNVNFGLAYRF